MTKKVSIIVPVYNVEKYLERCILSLLDLDIPKNDYEIIMVNDGSTDKSYEIAQGLAKESDNIILLTQENQGQSVARNYGIEKCCGEYIWFVDSDDKIAPGINTILTDIKKIGNPDVYSFFLQYVSEEGKFLTKAFRFPGDYNRLMSGREAVLAGYQPSSVCVFFIKRSFILEKHLRFYVGIYNEDVEFSYRMMANAKTVFFSEHVPYIYIKHPNSVVTSTSSEKVLKKKLDDIVIMKSFQQLSLAFEASDLELSRKIGKHVDRMAFGCVYSLYKNRKQWKKNGMNKAILAKLREAQLYPLKGSFDSWKKKLAASILNFEFLLK